MKVVFGCLLLVLSTACVGARWMFGKRKTKIVLGLFRVNETRPEVMCTKKFDVLPPNIAVSFLKRPANLFRKLTYCKMTTGSDPDLEEKVDRLDDIILSIQMTGETKMALVFGEEKNNKLYWVNTYGDKIPVELKLNYATLNPTRTTVRPKHIHMMRSVYTLYEDGTYRGSGIFFYCHSISNTLGLEDFSKNDGDSCTSAGGKLEKFMRDDIVKVELSPHAQIETRSQRPVETIQNVMNKGKKK
eukprot:CAMPEP_0113864912 /NCGR_PEP_ID=MMETSP0372-20130328/17696_1 /TAXON_ID=340204 /ORGANISM="Lankesteria abbotti" /LENGTH=243 /DNA_ID=CAMNT_0000848359 /DNA_START=224 /DNA_END=955 /DNA_ORIENTATION=+ /assembly_acc=CAM_ASM_000359